MYKLNILDAMTSEERKYTMRLQKQRQKDYDSIEAKKKLRDEIKNNNKRRVIEKKYLYYISDKGIQRIYLGR